MARFGKRRGRWPVSLQAYRNRPWLWGASLAGLTAAGALAAISTRRKRYLEPEEALFRFGKNAQILGAFLEGDARAYPLEYLALQRFLPDRLAERSVLITYDPRTRSALLFLEPQRKLTQSIRSMRSPLPQEGNFLTAPLWRTTLESWLTIHPESRVFSRRSSLLSRLLPARERLSYRYPAPRRPFDPRLPSEKEVFGIAYRGQAVALTREWLLQSAPLELFLGGEPIVVFFDEMLDIAAAYFRYVGERPHTFIDAARPEENIVARDRESGSFWDISGRCREGDFEGYSLCPLPYAIDRVCWWAWSATYPQTRLNSETLQLPAAPAE